LLRPLLNMFLLKFLKQLDMKKVVWNKSSFFTEDTKVRHTNIVTIYNEN